MTLWRYPDALKVPTLIAKGFIPNIYRAYLDNDTEYRDKWMDAGYDDYINNVSLDLGYPSSIELEDGSILTVFYAHAPDSASATIMQVRWKFEE